MHVTILLIGQSNKRRVCGLCVKKLNIQAGKANKFNLIFHSLLFLQQYNFTLSVPYYVVKIGVLLYVPMIQTIFLWRPDIT